MKIASKAMFVGLILFYLLFQTVSAGNFEFNGTITGYRGTNIIYTNIIDSKIPGLTGEVEVLLPQPVAGYILEYMVDQELRFDYLGRDISGKLISDAYYNGVPLQEIEPTCKCNYYYPNCLCL